MEEMSVDFLFFLIIIISIISWIGGAGKASRTGGQYRGYQKPNQPGGLINPPSATTQPRQAAQAKTSWQDLEKRLNDSLQNSTHVGRRAAEKAQASKFSNSAMKSDSTMRGNNSPLVKSTFHNHEEASGYLRDEMTESRVLWAQNRQQMQRVNQDFNQFVAHQHEQIRRMMQDARSVDR